MDRSNGLKPQIIFYWEVRDLMKPLSQILQSNPRVIVFNSQNSSEGTDLLLIRILVSRFISRF